MRPRAAHGLALSLLLLATGCYRQSPAPEEFANAPGNPVYQCADQRVLAIFQGSDTVTLGFPDRKLTLSRVPAASGAKYADTDGNQFWSQDGAILMLHGRPLIRCTFVAMAR
jgi:membrane-bound inhibitor of C-type lysozyme